VGSSTTIINHKLTSTLPFTSFQGLRAEGEKTQWWSAETQEGVMAWRGPQSAVGTLRKFFCVGLVRDIIPPIGKRPHLHPPRQTTEQPARPPPGQSVPSPPVPVAIRSPLQPAFPAFIPRFPTTAFVRTGFPQVNGGLYWYGPPSVLDWMRRGN
jgi:hypothetical protein